MSTTNNANANRSIFKEVFEIQERLWFSSFGDVFGVKDKRSNKEYAVKREGERIQERRQARISNVFYVFEERWLTRQLKKVQRVVNIPPCLYMVELIGAWEEEGFLLLQMETWDLFIDMLFSLHHLHRHHLVHMDVVKLDNIFLTIDTPTIFKLGDFGIVKDVVEFAEGDSRYLAPELLQGKVSTKADVFSLGLTLLEVACSVDLPKSGELWQTLRSGGKLPEPCPRASTVDSGVVEEMLAKEIFVQWEAQRPGIF